MANDVKVLIDLVKRGDGAERATKELRNLGTESAKSKRTLLELYAGVGLVQQGFAAISGVIRGVWSVLEQGAALEKTALQFDRLTESIGSTSDAMLGRLKEATRGMVSDAELMASASQIIGLGLAKTEEDTVRLARVISGLGLDMQQVIMTFANNSVMRLDALGLSVENVTRRAKELEAAGFQGDAFDAAVLEELEKRYKLLGGELETTETKLRRMEAGMNDAKNAFIAALVDGVVPLIDKLENTDWTAIGNAAAGAANAIADAFTEAAGVVSQAAMFAEMQKLANQVAGGAFRNVQNPELAKLIDRSTLGFFNPFASEEQVAQNVADMQRAIRLLNLELGNFDDALQGMGGAIGRADEDLRELPRAVESTTVMTRNAVHAFGDLGPVLDDVAQQSKAYSDANEQVAAVTEKANATEARRAQLFAESADRLRTLQNIAGGAFTDALMGAVEPTDNLASALFNAAGAAGASAETMALLAAATGDYTREQIEAALKQAALTARIEELGQALADGLIGVDEAIADLERFKSVLDAIPPSRDFSYTFRADMSQFDKDIAAFFGAPTSAGGIPEGRPEMRAAGGPVSSGMPYMVGEHGPEWFVPKDSGYIVNQQQAAQAVAGGGGAVTITQIFNDRAAAALGMAQIAQLQRARRAGAFA